MPSLIHTEKWYCPNHHHCGAVALIKTYACGCRRVEWIDRGRYDPDRCAPNPKDEYGPNHPNCDN